MNSVFLDTVGLLAQWDSTDQWHEAADLASQLFEARGAQTISTTFVFLECGNAAARRPYRLWVDEAREELERTARLIVPTADDWRAAWKAFRQSQAAQAGIVDHVSFVVMRRLGITDAFTNDRHFKAAGFNTLF